MKKKFLPRVLLFGLFIIICAIYLSKTISQKADTPSEIAQKYSPSPTPTPKPLTFAEMNTLYGPCVVLPTLMYHHIQDIEVAKNKNQQNLTVSTENFQEQMQSLKDKGYITATMAELVNFFDAGAGVAKKSVLLTFDDGYDDFYLNAYPILSSMGFKATMFIPTGLIDNPGYLSWSQITEMANSGTVLFANHTWSHKNMQANGVVDEKEISTADTQLSERGLGVPKIFAYPYGLASSLAETLLTKYGYLAAFTTRPGTTLCKKQRLELPRVRIGNTSISFYGF